MTRAKTCRDAAIAPGRSSLLRRMLPGVAACVATLIAAPVGAVDIPSVPLQSGAAYPPANVMFILDDSGSMEYYSMPHDVTDWDDLDNDITDKFSGSNTIYYDPSQEYLPWVKADGSRYTSGTSYTSAWSHPSLLTGSVDLSDEVQTWFAPKPGATDLSDNASFYRYQIRRVGGSTRVVRSEYLRRRNGNEGIDNAGCGGNGTFTWRECQYAFGDAGAEAAALTNYATWYSYHRTRMKVAKAGASQAFSELSENLRVGYDSIWNRSAYPIPVGTDGGLFRGSNRQAWFERLHAANGSGFTPLHGALQRAGEYFSDDSASGPWGPGFGDAQVSCRQNFSILTTDGYWNNFSGYTSPVGDADAIAGPTVEGPLRPDGSRESHTYAPARPYIDNHAGTPGTRGDTLADVAMHYWKRDLIDTLENNVPTTVADPAFWQHMVTFGVSIGLQGRLDPKTDLVSISNGSKRWGNPMDREDADRIDDLWHATVNGRGGFVTARNPTEFAEGLLAMLQTVATRLGSASNVSTNSTSFAGDTRVFQATYLSGQWSGELSAYDATRAGVATTPDWTAASQIQRQGRTLLTWNGSGGADFPTSAQSAALVRSGGLAPVTGPDNAAYLAGETRLERRNGGKLRNRDGLLGDIVNSSPAYLKDNETIFVGANDGMLHAFDALDGSERFAYVPGGVDMAALAAYSDPQYVQAHRYFVDGPIVVTTQRQTPGRNILVGALGRGGKGVFALDVTDAANMRRQDVMWEYSAGANLGQVLGEPLVATLNDATRTTALIVGNGINSDSGHAALLVINLATGALIREIDTGVGGDNGLFAPRGRDLDGNGTVDVVYAGDLTGRLWKFDLTSDTASSWTLAFGGQPMFRTRDGQPVTGGLAVGRDPSDGRRWVFFGTGRFLSSDDVTDATVQSLYGLVDDGASPVAAASLQRRSIVVTTTSSGSTVRAFEAASALDSDSAGWFIDLDDPAPGERVVTRPQLRGNALIVASMIPPDGSVCEPGGRGFVNALDAFSGASLPFPFFDVNRDGAFDAGDQVTGNGEQLPVGSIDLGVGMPTLPAMIDELVVVGGSNGKVGSVLVNPPGGIARRIRWREIILD